MDANALDECRFCVREFWKPWLLELLDIEDDARREEKAAVFDARDALSKSARDLALNRRLYAAEALLSIREAKQAVMKAMAAIDAEKHKRLSIDKEKYNIYIPRSDADTHYKEYIAAAIKAKKMQENRFSIMEDWKKRWAVRQEYLDEEESEEEEIPKPSKTTGKATEPHMDEPPTPTEPEDEEETKKSVHQMKPALKKKDADGPSQEKEKTHRGSKDKLPTEKKEHGTKGIIKENEEKGPSEKKEHGEKRLSKEKDIVVKKEPREKEPGATPADKKDPGAIPTHDKGVSDKEPKSTQGQEKGVTEKKETASQSQEKGPAEKKEPATTKPQEKPTVEKKEAAATQTQEKGATGKKEPPTPPPPPPQEKKPPAEPVNTGGVTSPEPKTETKPTQTTSVKSPEKPGETTAKKT